MDQLCGNLKHFHYNLIQNLSNVYSFLSGQYNSFSMRFPWTSQADVPLENVKVWGSTKVCGTETHSWSWDFNMKNKTAFSTSALTTKNSKCIKIVLLESVRNKIWLVSHQKRSKIIKLKYKKKQLEKSEDRMFLKEVSHAKTGCSYLNKIKSKR